LEYQKGLCSSQFEVILHGVLDLTSLTVQMHKGTLHRLCADLSCEQA